LIRLARQFGISLPQPFKYNVSKTPDGVKVTINSFRWKVFAISSLWSIWVVAGTIRYKAEWGASSLAFVFLLPGALLASLGAVIAVNAVLWYTLNPSQ
jgi:hypothetical protein